MIIRNTRINPNSREIQIKISYGEPDVRKIVKLLAKIFSHDSPSLIEMYTTQPKVTEAAVMYTLNHSPYFFGSVFPDDFKQQLIAWVWSSALRLKLFKPSITDPTHFYFAEENFKRPGRPKSEIDE